MRQARHSPQGSGAGARSHIAAWATARARAFLPTPSGPAKSSAGRQPVALERPGEDRAHPVVAADVVEPHRAASPTRPRATSPDHSASDTASGGAVPSSLIHREGSSARSAS